MSDIAFIYPSQNDKYGFPENMMPLGICWIAAFLEQSGFSVKILDQQVDKENLESFLKRESPKIVGVGGTTETRFESFSISEKIKKINLSIIVIYGGPHATFTAEDTLTNIPSIDIVVLGEGEQSFLEICKTVFENAFAFNTIKGISYRQKGNIIHNPPQGRLKNLDSLPFPARHLLKIDRYNLKMDFNNLNALSIITSRGCPINCTFCSASSLWGKNYTTRSPANVADEIEDLLTKYNIQGIKFFDSTLTLSKKHITGLCNEFINRRLAFNWECEVRADTVDESLLELMRDAGCYYIDVGLESPNERTLKNINKKITLQQFENVLDWANTLGLKTKVFLTWGHPGETLAEGIETWEYAKQLKKKVSKVAGPGIIRIYPGTYVESFARTHGYLPKNFSWSQPYFNQQNIDLGNSPFTPLLLQNGFGYKEIRKYTYTLWAEEHHNTILRKKHILKKIFNIRSLKEFQYHLNSLLDMVIWKLGINPNLSKRIKSILKL